MRTAETALARGQPRKKSPPRKFSRGRALRARERKRAIRELRQRQRTTLRAGVIAAVY
jgi:hypothetical protein